MNVYTYEVKVMVNVLAVDENQAMENLTSGQGVLVADKVETLINTTEIVNS
jgi:hypothetical protein